MMGPQGLSQVATHSWKNTHALAQRLEQAGFSPRFSGDYFHEIAIDLGRPAQAVIDAMADHGVLAGYALGRDYPELENILLVCATETKTEEDLDQYISALQASL